MITISYNELSESNILNVVPIWVDVKTRLPMKSGVYYVRLNGKEKYISYEKICDDTWCWKEFYRGVNCYPSHWVDIPVVLEWDRT